MSASLATPGRDKKPDVREAAPVKWRHPLHVFLTRH